MKVEAYMCDRCGALFLEPGKDWNFTHKEPESKTESRKIDFCHCMNTDSFHSSSLITSFYYPVYLANYIFLCIQYTLNCI